MRPDPDPGRGGRRCLATRPGVTVAAALGCWLVGALVSGCALVGPDYEAPGSPLGPDWYQAELTALGTSHAELERWWEQFRDPALDRLVPLARSANNSLEIAGLRVLEARAQLALAQGTPYPQTQVLAGGAALNQASENAANTAAGDLRFSQFDAGVSLAWEMDFWGRFRRQIEAAEAAFQGSVAGYDQALILITAQVAVTYLAIRTLEEQMAIARQNIATQQRSYDIVDVQFRNGNSSELDVLQARSLLLSTQATIPALQADLHQTQHALAVLLGMAPADLGELLQPDGSIPEAPARPAVGLPADLLRQRPDVRAAEYAAMAQNAAVGLAAADLYPSFSLAGSVGLVAAGNTGTTRTGDSGADELFSPDSLTYSVGPSFVWPFFNYGRIRNNVRVQDARLQQALVSYRETVLQAAREVEDAVVEIDGAQRQLSILQETVVAAQRANDVALLRFNEGFADYQRVLDAQQVLFSQQGRLVASRSDVIGAYIGLYLALGGGWRPEAARDLIDPDTRDTMIQRTDWGDLLEQPAGEGG